MTPTVTAERRATRESRTRQTKELFRRAHAARDSEERGRLLDEIIVLNMAIADAVVSRYSGRGTATEDLRQVAYAALTGATRRFDPSQGTEFVAFAVPTMRGEVRRYFRDHAWMVRPTRRIQELQPQINAAEDELWRELGRAPRPSEVANRIGVPLEAVVEALSTDGCFAPASLDKPVHTDGSGAPLGELLGALDAAQESCGGPRRPATAPPPAQPTRPPHLGDALRARPHPARDSSGNRRHPDAGLPAPEPHLSRAARWHRRIRREARRP